jgi:phosphoribosylamine---glycine ligase
MNILLLGSGGRESAIAWKLSQSATDIKLFIAPGNGGTVEFGRNVDLKILDFEAIELFCIEYKIEMLISGSEAPAVAGIWDYFQKEKLKHINVIAPSQISAMLEGSKAFAKEFMAKNNIPTAKFIEVTKENIADAYAWFETNQPPFVIKADGLAEGKGVVLPETKEEAKSLIDEFILSKKFGASSEKVVIEEFLDGIEFSIFVFTNGSQYAILPNAKDYKRRYEGNKGLNTGGMGCISPVPFVDEAMMQKVETEVIKPTIAGLVADKMAYDGFIYFGLINCDGQPKVIEYNCRLGDPEAEVLLPRMDCDILDLFEAGFDKSLDRFDPKINPKSAVTVMLVSDGYPETYEKGHLITGIENVHDSIIFHAGTTIRDYELVTNGGRVVAVTSLGDTIQDALDKSYDSIDRIRFKGRKYRTDIGFEFL